MPELSPVIKKLRENAGLTSKELSEKSGLSAAYISKIESGITKSLSLTASKKLAEGLGISLKSLLTELGLLKDVGKQPSSEMITEAFRSRGYSIEEVRQIMNYAKFVKSNLRLEK